MFIINKAVPVTNLTFNCIAAKNQPSQKYGREKKEKGITEKRELTLGVM